MRKNIEIIIVFVCILTGFFISREKIYGLVPELTKLEMIKELTDGIKRQPKDFNVDIALEFLEDEFIKFLYDNKIQFRTTNSLEDGYEEAAVATSYYKGLTKEVFIHIDYSDLVCFYHEIGHAISYNINKIFRASDTLKFKKIYEKEKDMIFSDDGYYVGHNFQVKNEYFKSCSEEYFAQCFVLYSAEVLDSSTETYKYIDEIVKKIRKKY